MREWLKEYREEKCLTQEETAQLSGISRNYYINIEQRKRKPTVDVTKK